MWNPTLIKKGISDKYVHRVLEWYVLGVIDLSRGETPSGDATQLSGEATGIQLKCEMHINKEAKETTSQTRPKRQRT